MTHQRPLVPEDLRRDPDALARAAATSIIRAAICISRGELEKPARAVEIARTRLRRRPRARFRDARRRIADERRQCAGADADRAKFSRRLAARQRWRRLALTRDRAFIRRQRLDRAPGIALPTAGFVAEGAAIPVAAAVSAGPTLSPHKIAVITTLTGELLRSSNAEMLARQVLAEACGPALDSILFSAAAATPDHPAGLLNGIAALTPSASTEKAAALVDDLQALATAIAPVAGNADIVIVAAPAQAVALALRVPAQLAWPILSSASLAAGVVIAIAASAVVSAIEGPPQIDASQHAELHRDTSPGEIVTAAGTIAQPIGSIFQTDQVALRLRWPSPGACARRPGSRGCRALVGRRCYGQKIER